MGRSIVLKALRLLSIEDLQKLSLSMNSYKEAFKMAVGEEFIGWSEKENTDVPEAQSKEAKVINFPKKSKDLEPIQYNFSEIKDQAKEETVEIEEKPQSTSLPMTSDEVLWQRQLTKSSGAVAQQHGALDRYSKSADLFIVKSKTIEGKTKIRFASTDGVLINKKHA